MTRSDTDTVSMILTNYEGLYRAYMRAMSLAWWHTDNQEWDDVDKVVAELRELAMSIDPNADGFSDLKGIDWNEVDFHILALDELNEIPVDERRSY